MQLDMQRRTEVPEPGTVDLDMLGRVVDTVDKVARMVVGKWVGCTVVDNQWGSREDSVYRVRGSRIRKRD